MKHAIGLVSLLAWAVCTGTAAGHEITYITTPADWRLTEARGINNQGDVVGSYSLLGQPSHGWIFSGGNLTVFDVPRGFGTVANDINDRGEIVGSFADERGSHGFRYDGLYATVDFPASNVTATAAYGINKKGQIVGSYTQGGVTHGFLYQEGQFATLDFPGAVFTAARRINDKGVIVGYYNDGLLDRAFVYDDGEFSPLVLPFGRTISEHAYGIDRRGDIVGDYRIGTTIRAYVDYQGTALPFEVQANPIFQTTIYDINDRGDYVGFAFFVGDDRGRAFIATGPPSPPGRQAR